MKLQEITANIRLRSTWEAIDMGFAMVQNWWKAIYFPLSILTFSIATLLYLLIPEDDFWMAGLIFWWLKPLYDRLVLHIISHKLFNEELSSWKALKAIPSLIWNTGFFQTMTFRRLSLSRGFNLPIWQLEQLRGRPRSDRQRVLHLAAHSQAAWLTIAVGHLEFFILLSLFALIALLTPENILSDFFAGLFNKKFADTAWLDYLNYVFYVGVVTFLHPFYMAGSFALYINRRTQLEAWDLELDFRKLSIRVKNLLKPKAITTPPLFYIFVLLTVLGGAPKTVNAETNLPKTINTSEQDTRTEFLAKTRKTAEASKKTIKEVMLTKYLDDKKTTKRWVRKEKAKKKKFKSDSDLPSAFRKYFKRIALFISKIIEFGLWILIAIAIGLLFYYRDLWLPLLQGGGKAKEKYSAPEIMFGMDVRAESLPDNISEEAQKLWQAGKHRESLSLLYRGALIRLINQEHVRLENSHTEGDVLHHANKQLTPTKQDYLKILTSQWKLIAYAHRSPADTDMQQLFSKWNSDFATTSSEITSAEGAK